MDLQTRQKILEKTKRDYQELAEEFSDTRANLWPELRELAKYVKDGDKVLDLGCGNGRLCELFKDKQVEYVGVDQSEKLIEIAKERLKIQDLRFKTTFLVADALNLPFEDNEFDVIFAVALLHHIPSKQLQLKVLKNCYRVLKLGGFLILTVWNLWQPKLLIKYKLLPKILFNQDVFILWRMTRTNVDSKHGQTRTIQRYYHAFFKNELKKIIENNSFKIIDIYYTRGGQKTNWLKGFNLITVARK